MACGGSGDMFRNFLHLRHVFQICDMCLAPLMAKCRLRFELPLLFLGSEGFTTDNSQTNKRQRQLTVCPSLRSLTHDNSPSESHHGKFAPFYLTIFLKKAKSIAKLSFF